MLANPIQHFRISANTHNVQLHVGRRRLVLTVGKSVRKWGAWVGRNVAGVIVKIVGHDCAKANCGPAQSVVCGLASAESGKSSPTTLMAWLKFPHHTHNMNKLVLKKTYVLAATPRFANKCLSRDASFRIRWKMARKQKWISHCIRQREMLHRQIPEAKRRGGGE